MREYDLIADWYSSERSGPIGVPEAVAMASSLAAGSLILDLGCGNGIPISRALLHAGHRVIGIDSAHEMLRRFKANFPAVAVVRGLVQDAEFVRESFDAVISWGCSFTFAAGVRQSSRRRRSNPEARRAISVHRWRC
jgi:SAM-dependent methyltransferase